MSRLSAVRHIFRAELSREFDPETLVGIAGVLLTGVALQFATFVIRNGQPGTDLHPSAADFLLPFRLFVPISAVLFTYATVASEQTGGTLRLLLAAPYDREEVLLGKLTSRLLLTVVPASLGVVSVAAAVAYFGPVDPKTFVLFALGTLVLGATFVSTSLFFSVTYAEDTKKALVNAAGLVVVSVFVWPVLTNVLTVLLGLPKTANAALSVTMPTSAYEHLVTAASPSLVTAVAVGALGFWCLAPFAYARTAFDGLDLA
ncbi:ABC transporter permease [Haloarchaeobius sp. HME9146]|uniref:ABC transporter permease n=1 Tax=Haloarchaeobius sp. HME9146 TaxID=2978732 RepID=UPI0021BF8378|nr:ABC transporter permease [Haloarchaeobius sp. HME9146]MCT9094698.1 ABC transporter permease [Haloarchaeobius sp. HME9146]